MIMYIKFHLSHSDANGPGLLPALKVQKTRYQMKADEMSGTQLFKEEKNVP